MNPTIRPLVIPVSDLDAAKAIYSALLGAPHTDRSYYVGRRPVIDRPTERLSGSCQARGR